MMDRERERGKEGERNHCFGNRSIVVTDIETVHIDLRRRTTLSFITILFLYDRDGSYRIKFPVI